MLEYIDSNLYAEIVALQEDYEKNLERQEEEKLHGLISSLSDSDKSMLYSDGLQLLKDQSGDTFDPECLPTLTVSGNSFVPLLINIHSNTGF